MFKLNTAAVKKLELEAKKEISDDSATSARRKIKNKLSEIEIAKKVVRNLEREYEDLLIEISE